MAELRGIGWVIRVGSRIFRRQPPARPWGVIRKREPLDAVSMEIGRGEALIHVVAYTDGRLRLTFGTGQEFAGRYDDMPVKVVSAARRLIDVAAPLVDWLPPEQPDRVPDWGTVRIGLHTPGNVYVEEATLSDLQNGGSYAAPVWNAFSELLGPMIDILFSPVAADSSRSEIPGLSCARRLWAPHQDPA